MYVIDEHAPLASVAVQTVIELPSSHVPAVLHEGPLPGLEPEPMLHAVLIADRASLQSWQVAQAKERPSPRSYVIELHTPLLSVVVHTCPGCVPPHTTLCTQSVELLDDVEDEQATTARVAPMPASSERPLMGRRTRARLRSFPRAQRFSKEATPPA